MSTNSTKIKLAWGNYNGLPTGEAGKKTDVGALYFTKDEGSLYLGVNADQPPQRVQGVVQSFSSYEEWATKTQAPYPADIIYYIAESNLLARWDPNVINEDNTKGAFIALNVTYSEFDALNTIVSGHTQTLESHTGTIQQHARDIAAHGNTIGQHGTAIGQHEEKIAAIQALLGTSDSSSTNTLVSRVASLESWKSNAIEDLEDLDKRVVQLGKDFSDGKKALENSIATTNKNLSTFQQAANKTHGELQDAINTLNGNIEKYMPRTEAQEAHNNILSYIDGMMQAANCLQFKRGVAGLSDINTIKAQANKIGDTYVITANFSATLKIENTEKTVNLYAGDLLIANSTSGSENDDGFISSDKLTWHLVETGYQDSHDPVLATWDEGDSTKDAPIEKNELIVTLTSLGEANSSYGDRGVFAIKSSGNINLSKTNDSDRDTYNFELCWDTF